MNSVNPKKLLNSKWTASQPQNKEKHFVVIGWNTLSPNVPNEVEIKAVLTGQRYWIPWRDLKDTAQWIMGWV